MRSPAHPSARRYALRIRSAGACGLQLTWSGHCAAGMPSSASSISSMPPGCDLEKAAFELVAAHQQPNAKRGVGASPLTQPREGRSVSSAWLRAHTRALRLSRDFRDDARDDDLRRRPHFPGPGKGLPGIPATSGPRVSSQIRVHLDAPEIEAFAPQKNLRGTRHRVFCV